MTGQAQYSTNIVSGRSAGDARPSTSHEESLRAWFLLRAIPGLGDVTLLRLIDLWKTPDAVFDASKDELIANGCSPRLVEAIKKSPDPSIQREIDRELSELRRTGIQVLTILDASYPQRLRTIADPPPILYASGRMQKQDELSVAIVGARRGTPGGRALTEEFARELATYGVTVVSGLARGIDAAAHRGALDGGGRTIAVLGCGVDRTYPPEHDRLRREIEARGAVLSEVPLGSPPHSAHFPRRNRIISGLSIGVVVTQAAINSGSLITAQSAIDQGRDVFAVPGFVKDVASRGTNALIRNGATLVEQAADIVEAIMPQLEPSVRAMVRPLQIERKRAQDFGVHEQLVYDVLSYEPRTIDQIVVAARASVSAVMAALLTLELRQRVRQLPGQCYVRA
ncbi:putative Protein SMF, DNA protecting protein DprA [Nitrospira sp. KM1]|uniref:DNA-processing protein DprA n=1 Tax=Nitrospira sp. KM1 TaxID=1936990 RepID=UPI0013A7896B|nr:DNA-processing protein DprA [Nitrospira sp. KM1]BCA56140.1 putative Protein SMF, DNA protecting protein DprA [Nitrospira sp. KM1]